jgi:ATP-dependent RNA helicase DHX8/PRP22
MTGRVGRVRDAAGRDRSDVDHACQSSRGQRAAAESRLYPVKIYRGKVSNIKDFGAFVTLEGVMGRVEGAFSLSIRGSLPSLPPLPP